MSNKVEISVQRFNAKYAGRTPLIFGKDNQGYTRTQDFSSKTFSELSFHFEFWYAKGETHACIHTTHEPDANINLIKSIQSKFPIIQSRLQRKLGPSITIVPLQGWSGGGAPNETHTLNIICSNIDPDFNADLMFELYEATKKLI